MIILITGATHAGKTVLAQRMLEKHHFPYLSLDHLKMGLIRSGNTDLTPLSDDAALTALLWPIAREMIKTAIENRQNLIVEGCYIPFDWAADFDPAYREHIRFFCLVLSERYIRSHYDDIMRHACDVEQRLQDNCTMADLLAEHAAMLEQAQAHGTPYILVEDNYEIDIEI